jgi:hypothetical protein
VLYLLTNEHDEWLDVLKEILRKDGWETVVTNHELELDAEQIDVSMAVDMDIARRAAVFIGNGVCGPLSSLAVANAGVVEQLHIEHRPSTVGRW